MLRAFSDHLEYLDLYHSSATIMSSAPDLFDDFPLSEEDTEVTPFCPPLTEFTKLRQLNITPLGLAGYQCAHPAGCKFRNHLPPKLESNGIYMDPGDWAREHFHSLDRELEGIALKGSRNGGGCVRWWSVTLHMQAISKQPSCRRLARQMGSSIATTGASVFSTAVMRLSGGISIIGCAAGIGSGASRTGTRAVSFRGGWR
jgi:hypothetical protein